MSPDASLPRHGGDLAFATRVYGTPPGGWLDLSTGINPNPYPVPPISPEALHRLPDPDALGTLIATARRAYQVPPEVELIAVPGTEAAIRLLPLLAPSGKVAIFGPTYGTYVRVWPDAEIVSAAAGDAAVAVVVNPNNPDGRVVRAEALPTTSFLVVDETFADTAPELSAIPSMLGTGRIVLRSLGKFYGLAGVRLGFVAAAPPVAQRLRQLLGDWPVSGPAIAIGSAALADDAWRDAMRAQLKAEADALRAVLRSNGLGIAGGTDLFVLVETANANALHRALAERGVWTRAFADHPRWLRFGLPGAANMGRLAAALTAL
ncbi:MAG TPA: threonine-phosphate decarboxylase [Bauldia sp.]|nr:threonine-phosphate decarboxylase [Bauldia sp.]